MRNVLGMVMAFVVLAASGCGQNETLLVNETVSATGTEYLVKTEPPVSLPVGDARKSTKDGEAVAVVGNIGGSAEPFVDGIAAFTIVDPKVAYCAPEEGCPTPWDYCCTQSEVKDNIATIKVVNSNGTIVNEDARGLLGVKELSTVVVEGTSKRDEQGNLIVLAKKIFVKKR